MTFDVDNVETVNEIANIRAVDFRRTLREGYCASQQNASDMRLGGGSYWLEPIGALVSNGTTVLFDDEAHYPSELYRTGQRVKKINAKLMDELKKSFGLDFHSLFADYINGVVESFETYCGNSTSGGDGRYVSSFMTNDIRPTIRNIIEYEYKKMLDESVLKHVENEKVHYIDKVFKDNVSNTQHTMIRAIHSILNIPKVISDDAYLQFQILIGNNTEHSYTELMASFAIRSDHAAMIPTYTEFVIFENLIRLKMKLHLMSNDNVFHSKDVTSGTISMVRNKKDFVSYAKAHLKHTDHLGFYNLNGLKSNAVAKMKQGRAYNAIFGSILNDSAIEAMVNMHKNQWPFVDISELHMHIATTQEEIEYAFAWQQMRFEDMSTSGMVKHASNSCMRYATTTYAKMMSDVGIGTATSFDAPVHKMKIHPSAAYNTSDFYVAYMTNSKTPMDMGKDVRIFARSVIGFQDTDNPNHPYNPENILFKDFKERTEREELSFTYDEFTSYHNYIAHVMAPIYTGANYAKEAFLNKLKDHVQVFNKNREAGEKEHRLYIGLAENRNFDPEIETYQLSWEGLRMRNIDVDADKKKASDVSTMELNSQGFLRLSSIIPYVDTTAFSAIPEVNDEGHLEYIIVGAERLRSYMAHAQEDTESGAIYKMSERLKSALPFGEPEATNFRPSGYMTSTSLRSNHRGVQTFQFRVGREALCYITEKWFKPTRQSLLNITINNNPNVHLTRASFRDHMRRVNFLGESLFYTEGFEPTNSVKFSFGLNSSSEVFDLEMSTIEAALKKREYDTITNVFDTYEFDNSVTRNDLRSLSMTYFSTVSIVKCIATGVYGFDKMMMPVEIEGDDGQVETHYVMHNKYNEYMGLVQCDYYHHRGVWYKKEDIREIHIVGDDGVDKRLKLNIAMQTIHMLKRSGSETRELVNYVRKNKRWEMTYNNYVMKWTGKPATSVETQEEETNE